MKREQFVTQCKEKYPHYENFIQTIEEITQDIFPYLESIGATDEDYGRVVRMFTPERVVEFRVDYERDDGSIESNTGYRVQHSSARGPYKGGLRFDRSVNRDILQFLALEQTFKNALTGLPIGSGKGGSDFNPKDKSEQEIKRFSQAFARALYQHIGANTDVPAGDMGVSSREIGYMVGEYKKITHTHNGGAFSGKPVSMGGSQGRTEATGFGVVYLAEHVLEHMDTQIAGKTAVVSGSGNVATYVVEKLIEKQAKVITMSDRDGYLLCEDGLTQEQLEGIKKGKQDRQSLKDMASKLGYTYHEGTPWASVQADLYIPCATQNEINEQDAKSIVDHGATLVIEGANMPSTNEAIEVFQKSGVVFVPAKAANAGGVAVSTLEMSQNSSHESWSTEVVNGRLQSVMKNIFDTMVTYGQEQDKVNYVKGANIGGFVRVFDAMKSLGW